jgi:hypothetical protein
MLLQGFMF